MAEATTKVIPRLKQRYLEEVRPALMREFGYRNIMEVPRVWKVVVNVGVGEAVTNPKALDYAVQNIATITGQKPLVTKARKSIAAFKLRAGRPIGVKVTLRGDRMWAFLDRLFNVALPRIRDFRGVSPDSFDGRGNYTLGLREQLVWPEIDYSQVDKVPGDGDHHCDHGEDRRRGAAAAGAARHAVPQRIGGKKEDFHTGCRRGSVARKCMIYREMRRKYKVRVRNRCRRCGRPRAYIRRFALCRICFRELALQGLIPGVRKAAGERAPCLNPAQGKPSQV
jgi:large subunit ribosomal protein L5